MVSPEKQAALDARMAKLRITEENLVEKFILGSGSGGQKINKTSSCVYLKHVPSGIEVKCQAHRSREMNRFLARHELCDRIEGIRRQKIQAQIDEVEKKTSSKSPPIPSLQATICGRKEAHLREKVASPPTFGPRLAGFL